MSESIDSVRIEILDKDQKELRAEFNHFVSLMNTHMMTVMTQLAAIREKLSLPNHKCDQHAERIEKLEVETKDMMRTQNKWIGGLAVAMVVIQILLSVFGPTIRYKVGLHDSNNHTERQP